MLLDAKSTTTDHVADFRREVLPLHSCRVLRGYARKLCLGDDSAAEDLLQVTFLKAWRAHERYLAGSNPRAWLATIMRNTRINQIDSARRRPETSMSLADSLDRRDEQHGAESHRVVRERSLDTCNVRSFELVGAASSDCAASADSMTDWISEERAAAIVDRALAELRARDRVGKSYADVWEAFEREGLDYAQIAKRHRLPMGTVMSRLHRARKLLEAALVEHGVAA